jgi:hypothetical protein
VVRHRIVQDIVSAYEMASGAGSAGAGVAPGKGPAPAGRG